MCVCFVFFEGGYYNAAGFLIVFRRLPFSPSLACAKAVIRNFQADGALPEQRCGKLLKQEGLLPLEFVEREKSHTGRGVVRTAYEKDCLRVEVGTVALSKHTLRKRNN
jgi:hypothetical protein